MEAPKKSGKIEIHGILFKPSLPEKICNAINTQPRLFIRKGKDWWFGMIIYEHRSRELLGETIG